MIHAGVCLCPYCGKPSTEAYYTANDIAVGAKLMRSRILRHKYSLMAYSPKNNSAENFEFHLISEPEKDGIPYMIRAKVNIKDPNSNTAQSKEVSMVRSCPHCPEHRPFAFSADRTPLFVIACVGKPSAGKSCWCASVSNALSGLNSLPERYPIIRPVHLNENAEHGEATDSASTGKSNFFQIFNREDPNKPVATIFLLDTAGENYRAESLTPDTPLGKLICGDGKNYPGIDAAIFVDPAVETKPAGKSEDPLTSVKIFDNIFVQDKLCSIPVAYLRTFSDRLIGTDTNAVLRENTFPKTTSKVDSIVNKEAYDPQKLADRIELQHQIYNNAPAGTFVSAPVYNYLASHKARVFLIQSCAVTAKGLDDYEQQFNVLDPLLWLINQLIFPYPGQGGSL